jgi:5'-nucleotidase
MKILLSNDDGYNSIALIELANRLSQNHQVWVVAPNGEQSGVGHAFTYHRAFTVEAKKEFDYPCYAVSGTPADSVKWALCELLKDEPVDVVISGINNGHNAGVAAVYSGTVACAREAALWGVPGVGFSVLSFYETDLFEKALRWTVEWIEQAHFKQMKKRTFWNINFPSRAQLELNQLVDFKCLKVCTQGQTMYEDAYYLQPSENNSHTQWQLKGEKHTHSFENTSDDHFLALGHITLVSHQIETTDYSDIERLQSILTVTQA